MGQLGAEWLGCAAKAGIHSFTISLRAQLKRTNVLEIRPGLSNVMILINRIAPNWLRQRIRPSPVCSRKTPTDDQLWIYPLRFLRDPGVGEGIRTLDPNLGKLAHSERPLSESHCNCGNV
jgi:NAD(P)-dependent dehydrogenase (short-subunit alcohol dehydrogenase family)